MPRVTPIKLLVLTQYPYYLLFISRPVLFYKVVKVLGVNLEQAQIACQANFVGIQAAVFMYGEFLN